MPAPLQINTQINPRPAVLNRASINSRRRSNYARCHGISGTCFQPPIVWFQTRTTESYIVLKAQLNQDHVYTMYKSNSVDSNTSSILRASMTSFLAGRELKAKSHSSTDSGLSASMKHMSLDDESLQKKRGKFQDPQSESRLIYPNLDRMVLKSFHEQDIYRSTFDFVSPAQRG